MKYIYCKSFATENLTGQFYTIFMNSKVLGYYLGGKFI